MIGLSRRLPAVLAVLVWIVSPQGAAAHAELLGSEPAAGVALTESPGSIRLWFTEPVAPGFTEAALFDGRGRRLDQSGARLETGHTAMVIAALPELGPGVYTVSWRALSAVDGHIDRGVVVFAVGEEPGFGASEDTPQLGRGELWLSTLARWLGYAAMALLAGTAVFHLAVPWAPRGGGFARLPLGDGDRGRLRVLVSGAAVALGAATVGDLALHSLAASDSWSPASLASAAEGLIVRTRFGAIWLARLALALALAWLMRDALAAPTTDRPDRWGAAAFLGALLLFTFSTMSHAAAVTSSGWLGMSVSWLHLAVVAVWLGGLVNLLLLGAIASAPMIRFSRAAGLAVAVLIGTGLVQALMLVGTGAALLQTSYGLALLLKLAFVSGALLLAYANRRTVERWLRGRAVERAADPVADGEATSSTWLRAELALAGSALAITAVIAGLPPAWQAYQQSVRGRPLETDVRLDGQSWALRLDPGRPGPNELVLRPPAGAAFTTGRLLLTSLEADLPSTSVPLAPAQDRAWTGAAQLGVTGRWQAEAVLRRSDGAEVLVRFPFDLAGPATVLPTPPILSGGAPSVTAAVAMGLVVLGLGLSAFVIRTGGLASWEGRGLIAATATVAILGGYVALRPQPSDAVIALNARAAANPVAPSDDSVARGARIYIEACAACHGETGQGDGPRVTDRGERLSDLRVHLTAGHTDGDLYYWIARGIGGTEMPAFGETLDAVDRWHLVNYLRTLVLSPAAA